MKRTIKNILRDNSGQFAVWIGLMGLPIAVAIGAAVDMENGNRYKNNLEAALDSAALAAVQPALLTDGERQSFAKEVFYQNFPNSDNYPLKLEIKASREEVAMVASLELPSFVGGAVGMKSVGVKETATAVLTKSDTVCVLALDEESKDAIVFSGDARFKAPTCSVQANSMHPQAIRSDVLTAPVARNFCSTGGAVGTFYPSVKTNCSIIEDPYKDLQIPPAGHSCDDAESVFVRDGRGLRTGRRFRESGLKQSPKGAAIIPDFATMSPGIYCQGLSIEGGDVELEPGVYHVWGDLHFTGGAQVTGDGVTFIIKGEENRLLIDEGALLTLKAPSEGLTAGLVFWQKYLNFMGYVFGKVPEDPEKLIATSEIRSGGGLNLIGTAYLPNHKLLITSENTVSSQSPATSFIAFQIEFGGKSNMQVAVDHAAAGIPPMKPYTDDGARLIH